MTYFLMRFNNNYQSYKTKDNKKKHIHIRVAEKKYKLKEIPKGFVVHHIDFDKDNNQYYNLILLHERDHRRIHQRESLEIKSKRSGKKD